MRTRALGIFRLLLTVTGFVLLIVFGSRAAQDASSMQAAGATGGRRAVVATLGIRLLLGLHNPYAIAPSVDSHLATHTDAPDQTGTTTRPADTAAETNKPGNTAHRTSTLPTVAQPRGPNVLGAQAVQSAANKAVPASDRSVKALGVPKAIINDTLDKDVTKSLEPVTNNLPILNHLL